MRPGTRVAAAAAATAEGSGGCQEGVGRSNGEREVAALEVAFGAQLEAPRGVRVGVHEVAHRAPGRRARATARAAV